MSFTKHCDNCGELIEWDYDDEHFHDAGTSDRHECPWICDVCHQEMFQGKLLSKNGKHLPCDKDGRQHSHCRDCKAQIEWRDQLPYDLGTANRHRCHKPQTRQDFRKNFGVHEKK